MYDAIQDHGKRLSGFWGRRKTPHDIGIATGDAFGSLEVNSLKPALLYRAIIEASDQLPGFWRDTGGWVGQMEIETDQPSALLGLGGRREQHSVHRAASNGAMEGKRVATAFFNPDYSSCSTLFSSLPHPAISHAIATLLRVLVVILGMPATRQ